MRLCLQAHKDQLMPSRRATLCVCTLYTYTRAYNLACDIATVYNKIDYIALHIWYVIVSFTIVVIRRTPYLWHSVQTLFWSPQAIEIFGYGGEFWTEGLTQVASCCVLYANIRGLHKILLDLSLIAIGGDVIFVLRLISLPGATFPSLWFQVLGDWCSYSGVRLIGFEGWLYTCVMELRHVNSIVMSLDIVKS